MCLRGITGKLCSAEDQPSSALDKINAGTVKTPSETKNINSNGITDVSLFQYAAVNVALNVSEKTITNNGTYLASDENVDGNWDYTTIYVDNNIALTDKNSDGLFNLYTFSGLGSTEHTLKVTYQKDSPYSSGTDTSYFYIPSQD